MRTTVGSLHQHEVTVRGSADVKFDMIHAAKVMEVRPEARTARLSRSMVRADHREAEAAAPFWAWPSASGPSANFHCLLVRTSPAAFQPRFDLAEANLVRRGRRFHLDGEPRCRAGRVGRESAPSELADRERRGFVQ
jgi:hypothetical protein